MRKINKKHPFRLMNDMSAVTSIEYALLMGLMMVAIIGGLGALHQNLGGSLNNTSDKISASISGQTGGVGLPGLAPANDPASAAPAAPSTLTAVQHN
jgi:Flp pilus assembly pilin Flp